MGVGDRHSKRVAAEKAKAESAKQAHEAFDREIDDVFSAWDVADAGAHEPDPAQMPDAPAVARPRVDPKTGPVPADALVDPVAMRDIVLSRARTVDDPLTTRVLAEIARSDENEATPEGAENPRGQRGPLPQRARTRDVGVNVAPPKILSASIPALEKPTREIGPAHSPDTDAVEPTDPASPHTQPRASEEIAVPRSRTTRHGIAPPELPRKK
ncbi:MAG TPA: hypothetical protein VNO30_36990 [Kofleriaceae bacterium]|nr:hypothetical protein [Kofleriaceae bacterium]